MTLEQKQEFEQWFIKILNQIHVDRKTEFELDWIKVEDGYIPYVPVSLIAELSDEKLFELKKLSQRYF